MIINIPREELHQKVYLFGLALLVCCLPLSKYMLSISQFLLAANWIMEGDFRQKARTMLQKPAMLLFSSLFFVYAASLLFSENSDAALLKIKNVLPVLVLTIVMGTSKSLSDKQTKWLLLLFSGAVLIAAMVCTLNFIVEIIPVDGNFRKISLFMIHIVFSMMIVMAICILFYFTFYKRYTSGNLEKFLYLTGAFLLILFLFFLKSFTGILIFLTVTIVFALNLAIKRNHSVTRIVLFILVSISVLAPMGFIIHAYNKNFTTKPPKLTDLEATTANGNPYSHNLATGIQENGHFSDIYICEPELLKEWNKISRIPYHQTDGRGQAIFGTVKRYLTSLGLRKDSAGLSKLSRNDIDRIEKGLANYKFGDKPDFYQRIYETLWEVQVFTKTGYVQHHSLGQRFAFYRIAAIIIRDHPWIGVGIGDMQDAMLAEAGNNKLYVDPRWEGQPHNQFLSFLLAFGILGFLWIMYSWIQAVLLVRAHKQLLFNLFAIIMLISMLVVDPLHSYFCIMFFAFFGNLFLSDTHTAEKEEAR
jgi:O-antigen ligase